MNITQTAILTEARRWIGTRFQHQGRVRASEGHKGGCDCIGLISGVLSALAIPLATGEGIRQVVEVDVTNYSRIPDGKRLYETLSTYLVEVPKTSLSPADIALFRIDTGAHALPQHVGFISNYQEDSGNGVGIIHAYAQARKVCEHRFDALWQERLVAVFRIRAVAD